MYTVPRLLPVQFTDDSIIPAIVTNVIPASDPNYVSPEGAKKRRNSLAKVFKKEKEEDKSKLKTRVVFMPRREYLKWFAKDENGEYIGTEPKKQWTEEELDETFGKFRPNFSREKKARRNSAAARMLGS
jgi:ribosome recycling factor